MQTAPSIFPARYHDVERIARGAMGDVYRATDSSLGRVVAVKVLATPLAADEPARLRFARESRAAAQLSGNSNIVTIYDVGETGGRPYLVMEYMPGGSLEQRLRDEGARPTAQVLRWLDQVAVALDHAHASGVVHRDVKPGNLLLDAQDDVHVADFGIASSAGSVTLTAAGTVLGTVGYLAPEQAAGERATAASDRYALGVVAWELLTGERPFARESPTAEATAHVSEPVPSVSEGSGLPARLDPVFERALAKQPDARYTTCAGFVAAVRDALERPEQRTRRYALPPAPVAVRRHRHPARWPLVVAALGAALVVAVVLAVALSGHPPPKKAAPRRPPAQTHQTPVRRIATDPHALNDRAWSLMQRGDYAAALPLLERAVPALRGAGPADSAEGFANYNLGYTLLRLGRCSDALPYLLNAQQLEPQRTEVGDALRGVQECLAPPPGRKEKEDKHEHRGKGKGKHHH